MRNIAIVIIYVHLTSWNIAASGKKARKEKQLLKAIKDNVLELSKEEVEHLKHYLIRKTTQNISSCC
jgi:hypothetical protein